MPNTPPFMSPALSSAVDDSAATVAGLGFGKVGSVFSSVMFLLSAVVVAFTLGTAAGGTTSASVVNASSGTSTVSVATGTSLVSCADADGERLDAVAVGEIEVVDVIAVAIGALDGPLVMLTLTLPVPAPAAIVTGELDGETC